MAVWAADENYAKLTLALEMEISSGCKGHEAFVLSCHRICAASSCLTTSNTTTNCCIYVKACNYECFLAVAAKLV